MSFKTTVVSIQSGNKQVLRKSELPRHSKLQTPVQQHYPSRDMSVSSITSTYIKPPPPGRFVQILHPSSPRNGRGIQLKPLHRLAHLDGLRRQRGLETRPGPGVGRRSDRLQQLWRRGRRQGLVHVDFLVGAAVDAGAVLRAVVALAEAVHEEPRGGEDGEAHDADADADACAGACREAA